MDKYIWQILIARDLNSSNLHEKIFFIILFFCDLCYTADNQCLYMIYGVIKSFLSVWESIFTEELVLSSIKFSSNALEIIFHY